LSTSISTCPVRANDKVPSPDARSKPGTPPMHACMQSMHAKHACCEPGLGGGCRNSPPFLLLPPRPPPRNGNDFVFKVLRAFRPQTNWPTTSSTK
jgi:hypothetical protein